jgi:asparagine synthase (glutamine-hydrolysing)
MRATAMNQAIKHRGPDDEDVFVDEYVSLGHVRLAVMDITAAGKQPMRYIHGDKSAIIVFNGEIYNFPELRAELEAKGYRFTSKTDTEVILASYLEHGFECVNRFNGMWAFAIYDPVKNIIFCSRDRLGVKPFYYYFQNGVFIFSSELKGILSHKDLSINTSENINQDALVLYFMLGYIPSPYSIYQNTFKLEQRQNLVFNLRLKNVRKWYYYQAPNYAPVYDSKKLIEEGRKLIEDAVKLRMVADVPVGAFLSGGLDSTTIVGVMREFVEIEHLHTFSIGFEGKYDETPYVKIANDTFKTNHHHKYFEQNDFQNLIDAYVYYYDEPFGDFSGFPTFELSKLTRQLVTVSLSGDGGDEIFGGYPQYNFGYRLRILKKIPKPLRIAFLKIPPKEKRNGNLLQRMKRLVKMSVSDPTMGYAEDLAGGLAHPVYSNWISSKLNECAKLCSGNFAETLRIFDLLFNTLPDDYMTKVDRASMAYALEVRSPFLDYRFIEFSQHIPTEWKIDLFRTKKLFRKMIKGIIPEEIIRRGKKGFEPPIKQWITDETYEPIIQKASEYLKDLNPELWGLIKANVSSKKVATSNFYTIRLFIFGKWFEKWIDNTNSE